MYKGNGRGGKPRIQADNEYIRRNREEFDLCRTPGCRNVIAKWATGAASNGYCTACRRGKR